MRTFCLSLLATLLLVLPARAEDAAAALFQKIEAAATGPDTLRFRFTAVMTGPMSGTVSGTVEVRKGAAGEKDKLRFKFSGDVNGEKGETTLVSDGKAMKMVESGHETKTVDLPDDLKKNFLALALRGGAFYGTALIGDMEFDSASVSKTAASSKFSSAEMNVKTESRDASSVEIAVTSGARQGMSCKTTLWVDAKTLLPIKLVAVSKTPEGNLTVTETWHEVEAGKEIDDKTFALPK